MQSKMIALALCLIALINGPTSTRAEDRALTLWYDQPAAVWTEALPVGNGRLGAMVFGTTDTERLQFNDDTLWTGGPRSYAHEGARESLPEIRRLLFDGQQRDAERLAGETFMSQPLRQMAYQPCGDLLLEFRHDEVADYRRSLDLNAAVTTVRYRVDDATFTREVFSSFPDQTIVIRLSCDKPGRLAFTAKLDSPHPDPAVTTEAANQLVMTGGLAEYRQRNGDTFDSVLKYAARLSVRVAGGQCKAESDSLRISNADTATLILAAATSFVNYRDVSGDPIAATQETLAAVQDKSYDDLLAAHQADFRELFHRVTLDLGATEAAKQPTDERIRQFNQQDDPQLAELYFQYGRYLLIASSRPGSQPANLQGIWNDKLTPPWECKWTVNINTEMNYWPAELTNLSECHEPLFDMLDEVAESGSETAKVHYGSRGWVLHHNTDLWRGTAPINASNHGIWPVGGAWLCQHLWDHYQFTGDRKFLANRGYPLMKQAALFFVDNLVEDPRHEGWLVSSPSNSPENGGLVAGPTMDHQIIRCLFRSCISASEVLDTDRELRQQLQVMLPRIAPHQIGQHGQLQEWLEDKDNPKNQHRHVSHLWGLHPGWEITPRGTPDLCDAAKQSLEFRGDGGTGWSLAWKINFWARFEDGDRAYQLFSNLLTPGRTFPNMFDAHPPFQIDGNFGGTSGIAEMLVQSHAGEIAILPAWPRAAWPTGQVTGLCARGGVEVDIKWQEGQAKTATLEANATGEYKVRAPKGHQIARASADECELVMKTTEDGCVVLRLDKDQPVTVEFKPTSF